MFLSDKVFFLPLDIRRKSPVLEIRWYHGPCTNAHLTSQIIIASERQ
uniref:Uncharacterized protein n=1 Tax=Anguilla anguilla TaxID=7936 RepID=A0A0E9WRY2_ANGAN